MKMRYIRLFCILLLLLSNRANAQESVEVWNLHDLMSDKEQIDGSLKVYNFWATWCKPCVEELPFFQKVATEEANVEFIFISLDHVKQLLKVQTFAEKHIQTGTCVLLDETNYNEWIDLIDPAWGGSIPATLFVNEAGEEFFYEQSFDYESLKTIVDQLK